MYVGWLREASSGRQTGPQPKESVVNFDDVKCHFHTLPDEIFVEIFSYLNVKEKVLMERGRMSHLYFIWAIV